MPKEAPLAATEIDLIRPLDHPGSRRRHPGQRPPAVRRQSPAASTAALRSSPRSTSRPTAGCPAVAGASTKSSSTSADGSGLVARLVGLSERIESARFSPDGKRIAGHGGLPGRMGELQVWDLTEDMAAGTLEGRLALGSGDVRHDLRRWRGRPMDSSWQSAAPTRRSGRSTATTGSRSSSTCPTTTGSSTRSFSVDGSNLVSVGRDMTAKLYDVKDAAVHRQRHLDHSRRPQGGCRRSPDIRSGTRSSSAARTAMPRLYRTRRVTSASSATTPTTSASSLEMKGRRVRRRLLRRRQASRRQQQSRRQGTGFVCSCDFDTKLPMRSGRSSPRSSRPSRPRRRRSSKRT